MRSAGRGPAGVDPDLVALAAMSSPATRLAKSPVPLFTDRSTVASTSTDGTEDDLLTNTIPAGQLAANGDRIDFEYVLNGVTHATATRRYRAYFAGTKFTDSNNLAATAGHWAEIQGSIIRVSSTEVRVLFELVAATDTTKQVIAVVMGKLDITGLDLATALVFRVTGTAAGTGAAPNDIVLHGGSLTYVPAP